MARKQITQYDRDLGARIRLARLAQKMSTREVAELIGCSYQQVQKYESGDDRVPAGRIDRLVTALNRPISYFFPTATEVRASIDPLVGQLMLSKDGHRIAAAWPRIEPEMRKAILTLIERAARGSPE